VALIWPVKPLIGDSLRGAAGECLIFMQVSTCATALQGTVERSVPECADSIGK
jgi:hypothetical protein